MKTSISISVSDEFSNYDVTMSDRSLTFYEKDDMSRIRPSLWMEVKPEDVPVLIEKLSQMYSRFNRLSLLAKDIA